ncbi:hypothetical protein AB1Y20_007316 [Prymnesium parvum]|uniref:Uncharacterized protein n=1 Tax=Prymnesium parvum TaxID=97485 RepID=A0AB34IWR4_PRYPA|mmetsp:Transcript_7206/g.17480  ORF Transcript_7206/g.17480 Transcript_7206/m.17480 type:complete len:298 (-) Transcript_7206:52-945(-)
MADQTPTASEKVLSKLHLVATDMDGTFLSPTVSEGHANGVVSERSAKCAAALQAAGVVFCIATGRPAPALQDHVDRLGVELPCVCFNGAAILTMRPGAPPTPLYERPLPAEIVRAVCEFADAEDVCLSYSLVDRAVARCSTEAHASDLVNYVRLEGVRQATVTSCAELLLLPPPLKMVVITATPDALAAKARAVLGAGVHVIAAEMHVEFLPQGVHKGSALSWLCEHTSIPLACTLTFGDNHNDIEMLKASGFGVAMANAKPEVKAVADLTLEWSNADDGVARQCELMLAEGRLCSK